MFMKFDMIHQGHGFDEADGIRDKQKICINLGEIETVQQSGRLHERQIPIPDMIDGEFVAQQAPIRPPRAQRRRDSVFVIDKDRFVLWMKRGNTFTVAGDFEEFSEILCRFREKMESV